MQTFEDAAIPPRTWTIHLNLPILRTIKHECDLDLFSDPDPSKALSVFWEADTEKQLDAIDIAVSGIEQKQQFDSTDFALAVNSEVILHAILAFIQSLGDFYPSLRKPIHALVMKARQNLAQGLAQATATGNEIASQIMDSQPPGNGSTSLEDTSESIRTNTA